MSEELKSCPNPKCGKKGFEMLMGGVRCGNCGLTADPYIWNSLPRREEFAEELAKLASGKHSLAYCDELGYPILLDSLKELAAKYAPQPEADK